MTLEHAWEIWTPGRFRDVMRFLEIQASVQNQRSSSGADPDVTQASFEHLRRQRDEATGGDGGHRRDHDPAAA